ncbi:hypothetical protein LLS1_27270 [Leifsonia sp. LS1]|nr:hypothetical protein LLS1_27270 [Leifsonia sp. LS1]
MCEVPLNPSRAAGGRGCNGTTIVESPGRAVEGRRKAAVEKSEACPFPVDGTVRR